MELIRGLHNLRDRHRGCVLSIGTFDGIHRGHQALIGLGQRHAQRLGLPLLLLTFEPTAREFFDADGAPRRINVLRDKVGMLEQCGVDYLLIARFDQAMADMSARAFIEDLLIGRLGMRGIVVGDDAHFGKMRSGDIATLRAGAERLNYLVDGIDTLRAGHARCSSSAIRAALSQADLASVAEMLGRPYRISGRVRRGLRLGRKLGMRTANIHLRKPLAIRDGVYAVRAHCQGQRWDGVANIGRRPSVAASNYVLETHVFGDPGDLYGALLQVEFCRFLRPEAQFDSLDALSAQMQRDAEHARSLLSATS